MRLKALVLLSASALAAVAQAPASHPASPQTAAVNASVSGVVRDAGTGEPIANYVVSTDLNATWFDNTILTNEATKEVKSITDDQGRYKLSDLPAGPYRIHVSNPQSFLDTLTKNITLAGHDLEGIDFNFVVEGSISGRVTDENNEPMPGMTVFLISREYYLGMLGYFFKSSAQTNDRGEYKLAHVAAGHPFFLIVEKRDYHKMAAHSEAPLNPKLRRPVPMRTWYPNVAAKEGAIALVLRAGEHREGIDVEVKKSPSFCIDGTMVSAGGAQPLDFSIEAQQPSSGSYAGGAMYVTAPFGTTSANGEFRICELYPGSYRLTAYESASNAGEQAPSRYIAASITITDHDLRNLKFAAMPGIPLEGEVVWDGEPPQRPVSAKLGFSLQPLLRTSFRGEMRYARADIPGTFALPGLLMDEYSVRAFLNAPGLYVRDVTYAGKSVRYEPLRLGSAVGNGGVRVSVGRDGATLKVRVTDKDGNPVGDMRVLLMPAEIGSEAVLETMLRTGSTDQLGNYTSSTLAPGKYYVAASSDFFDDTPESIGKIWRSRNGFKEIDLAPNASVQVSLDPVKIE